MTLSEATLSALSDWAHHDAIYADPSEPQAVRDEHLQYRRVAAQAVCRELSEDVRGDGEQPAQLTLGGIA